MLWLALTAAHADDTAICMAIKTRDVAEIERLVATGTPVDVFCEWSELGRSGTRGGSSGARRGSGRDAVAIIATGGVLAPFIALGRGRRGGGGSPGVSSVDLAIDSGRKDILVALNSDGDLRSIEHCFVTKLAHGSVSVARLCGESLTNPTLTSIDGDSGTPARVRLIRDLDVAFGPPRVGNFLDWGTSWARNPDGVQTLLDMGMPREDLRATAASAFGYGPLEGLATLRDRFDVPLVVHEITGKWIESSAFRKGVEALDPDLSHARADWDFLAEDIAKRPYAIDALLKMGLEPRVFDGSIGPLLEEGHPALAKRMLAVGAAPRVDFRIDELIAKSDYRSFILEHDIAVDGTWIRHPWSDREADAVLSDPELLDFTERAGISMCHTIEVAHETGRLHELHGQRLIGCDDRDLEHIGPDLVLLRAAAADGEISARVAGRIAPVALDADKLDVLAFLVDQAGPVFGGYHLTTAVQKAFSDGRIETAIAGLAVVSDIDGLVFKNFAVAMDHLPDDRFSELDLGEKSRQRVMTATLKRKRWPAARAVVGPLEDGPAVLELAMQVEAPADLVIAIIETDVDPNYPFDPLPMAIERSDADFVAALLDHGAHAGPTEIERAFALGYDADLLSRMISRYTPKGTLRRLRKQARADGWSEADAERLRRPTRTR